MNKLYKIFFLNNMFFLKKKKRYYSVFKLLNVLNLLKNYSN